jgi:hypothetical protein
MSIGHTVARIKIQIADQEVDELMDNNWGRDAQTSAIVNDDALFARSDIMIVIGSRGTSG